MKLGFIANNDLDSVARGAQFAAGNGFEGLEFNFWANFADLTKQRVAEMRAFLDDHGATASAATETNARCWLIGVMRTIAGELLHRDLRVHWQCCCDGQSARKVRGVCDG